MNKSKKERKEKIDFRHNLRVYWNLVRKYRWYYLSVILIIVFVEISRLGEKLLFKVVIDEGTKFSSGIIIASDLIQILILVAIFYFIIVVVKLIGKWVELSIINRLDSNVIFDLKSKFFNHIVGLSHRFHTTHKTGSLISRLGRGSRAVEIMTDFFLFNFVPLLIEIGVFVIAFAYFDMTSSIVILITAVAFIGWSFYISYLQQDPSLKANSAEDREKAFVGDVFSNIDSVKYYGKEKIIGGKFNELSSNTKFKFLKLWDLGRAFEVGQSLILAAGTFFLIYFPLKGFIEGEITIGTVAFIYASYLQLMGPLFGFTHSIRRLYQAMADFQALFEYAKITNDIKDEENAEELRIKKGEIEFDKIKFSYHERKVIDNVSLKIKSGEKVALVGHSGSGKTTLVKLLYRFYDVNWGAIRIDGKDIREFKQESLREEMSIVPQEAILFDDSIYNNILFSNPKAERKEVMGAIKFAQLDEFVNRLPSKENTIVGERGVKLSGGEKQRVSIARAILANKKVLVLDEATSSLDSKTESEIQRALGKLMKGRTSIIIAHRLSTIMSADKIVVMDRGKIVQMGTHRQLINKRGVYSELWNLQKGGYIE